MNILVTGGNGFLGGAIVKRLLAAGHRVRSVQRSDGAVQKSAGVDVIQGSITDQEICRRACDGIEAVFHVAAKAGVWGRRSEFFAINLDGTRTLLEAAQASGVQWFVHTSTPSVVFSGEPFRGDDESLPLGQNFLCAYAESKAIAEREVLAADKSGGMRTCALRPHLIWGPGDPHLVPKILERGRQGRLRQVGEGENRVDMTHVDNAADGHVLALDALMAGRSGGKAYFLSDGHPVNLWGWIRELFEKMEVPPIQKSISFKAAYRLGVFCEAIWGFFRIREVPPMTRFVAVELAKDHWFSIESAKKDLHYAPSKKELIL